jgi:hypothetical protein
MGSSTGTLILLMGTFVGFLAVFLWIIREICAGQDTDFLQRVDQPPSWRQEQEQDRHR